MKYFVYAVLVMLVGDLIGRIARAGKGTTLRTERENTIDGLANAALLAWALALVLL